MQLLPIYENFTVEVYNEVVRRVKLTSKYESVGLPSSPFMAFLYPS
ncbi:hypothetical protein GWK48_02460 [Metallosphaera tengchongensis]|uniref:Uncharacterized protein n=2 Tax=Metallosphaera tengchongensis TaxID=1532350 RepID=A0A6N0NRM1_9CREN|nr:hypothetical protein GWK48_02460 [Metallosphaera tengchongensis]